MLLLSRPKLETPLRPLKTDSRSLGLCVHSPNPTGAAWSSRAWGINSSLRVQSPPSVQSVPLQTANVPVLTRAGCSDLFPSCVSLFSTQNAGAQDEKVSGKPKGRSAPPPDLHAPGSSTPPGPPSTVLPLSSFSKEFYAFTKSARFRDKEYHIRYPAPRFF